MSSNNETEILLLSVVKLYGDCVPWIDLLDVVLTKALMFVPGTDKWDRPPMFNTSNCLFCVAVTAVPPMSPVAFAVPLVVIS